MSGGPLEWSPELVAALEQALAHAHGRRQTRLLSAAEVRACADEALTAPLTFAWRHAGEVPDPRGLTTLVLAVATARGVGVGVAEVRAMEPTPARAFKTIPGWDRYDDAVNALAVQRWAASAPLVVPVAPRARSLDAASLFEAVRARPGDDEPRLMLADFLTEQGDPRGEFIAVQCELAAGSSREAELLEREAALLHEHRAQWEQAVPRGVRVDRYERGFASSVSVVALEAVPLVDRFAASALIEQVRVTSANPNPAVLAATPWLQSVRRLALVNPARRALVSRERLEVLLSARTLRGLEGLSFEGHCLQDEGFEALAKGVGAAFPRLRSLSFEVETVTAVGLSALVAAKWFAQIESFSLIAARTVGPGGVEAFVGARSPGSLVALTLNDVNARTEGALALAGAKRLGSLRWLGLASNRLALPGAQALLDSPWLAGARIDLQGNGLSGQVLARGASPRRAQ